MSFNTKVEEIINVNYYSRQTLSSDPLHVAGISQVMKHITQYLPQMVSITKLYLTL